MDYKLTEFDYDILELLQKNTGGLSFTKIVNKIGKSATDVYKTLTKLRKWNLASLLDNDYAYYKITQKNERTLIRKVCCPYCNTTKRVHDENQARVVCLNPECTFPGGKERQFEILSRELLKKGIKKRINHIQ